MDDSDIFLKSVLDSILDTVAVIDQEGFIVYVNSSWKDFGKQNHCLISTEDWIGVNYLDACRDKDDEYSLEVVVGLELVLRGERDVYYIEYPCHSPDEQRWFMMRITPLQYEGKKKYVVIHQNITERKLAELEITRLSRIDSLTKSFNRRYFDQFINEEWRRCERMKLPIVMVMVDIDHFKMLNDAYGHQYGDECLEKVASVLNSFARRPGDICARYGGEEFALVFSNVTADRIQNTVGSIRDKIRDLKIENKNSPTVPYLTVSLGVSIMYPSRGNSEYELIKTADEQLYLAKQEGRNRYKMKVG